METKLGDKLREKPRLPKGKPQKTTYEHLAIRVSRNTICGNVLLSVFKLLAGIIGNSAAMVSDAVHSLSDVFCTFIVIIGVKIAQKQADSDHPYGHERFECVAALILAVILCGVGVGIGYGGVRSALEGGQRTQVPGILALVAAILSIVVKEAMYWYARAAAKKINSGALMAEAWHHRSDAFSSIGSFVGILGARIGFPVLDPIACVVICFFIVKVAYDIFSDSINKMIDKTCDEETEEKIRAVILAQENVRGVDLLQTRLFGEKIYVDVEISVDGNLSVNTSHDIAHMVHDAIEKKFENIKHCMVHVNPRA
jgi:cation diffusion facilitator family transporter